MQGGQWNGRRRPTRFRRFRWGRPALIALSAGLLLFGLVKLTEYGRDLAAARRAAESLRQAYREETPAPAETVPAEDVPDWTSSAPIGHEPGQQLADFTLTCYDDTEFHLADTRGKVTFINLWATWCTPCKAELPYFNDLCQAKKEDTAVLVVHSSMVMQDTPEDYLADKDYRMFFATDTGDEILWNTVGGSFTLPQTIVLNRKGEVIYNKIASVTPEVLASLYEEAAR